MENTTTTKKRKFESNPSSKSDNFFEVKPTLKQVKLNFQPTNNPPKATPWHTNQQLLTKFIPLTRQLSLGTGHIPTDSLLICSWNINGLKRIVPTGQIQAYFKQRKPDIFCLNETKVDENEVEKLVQWIPPEYTYYFNSSKLRKGYSGVAIITKYKPISVQYGMGIDKHDKEGRLLTLEFETFYMVSCYVPLSGMGFKRLPYRINEWDPSLRAYLSKLKEKKPVVICGDFNVTHRPIDGWQEGEDFIGSSTIERNSFSKLLDAGFIDTFRYKYPGVQKFSWWNLSKGNKEKDRGRRFDYFLTSQDAAEGIKDAFINKEVNGSDHCPVELLFNPNFKVQKKGEEQNNQKQNSQKPDNVIIIDSQASKAENVIVID